MRVPIALYALIACLLAASAWAEPIKVDPANPHLYFYHGKPVLLITSAEHYGAVINKAFDYVAYFDALKAHGLNYTRIYPGVLFEPMGKFLVGNTLAPKMNDLVLPWARSSQPGYLFGGNKFDLTQWDPGYFDRLHAFLQAAAEREIVVEVCLFNSEYSDTWPLSPLYWENNKQQLSHATWQEAQSLLRPDLTAHQDAYIRKLVTEVNAYDNVILEDCDEPADIGTGVALAGPWVQHIGDVVIDTERSLPKKHLLAQEMDGPLGSSIDVTADPHFPIIVTQYLYGHEPTMYGGEMGGLRGLDEVYHLNKPIEFNETFYYPLDYKNDKAADSRAESWEFIVGGGAGFNQLNGLWTVDNPAGKGEENERLLTGLQNLKTFMESFEFDKLHPDKATLVSSVPEGAYLRLSSEPGKQYALYLHHSKRGEGGYESIPGHYRDQLKLKLPKGAYRSEWIDPASGKVIVSEEHSADRGPLNLTTPAFTTDIALSIKLSTPAH